MFWADIRAPQEISLNCSLIQLYLEEKFETEFGEVVIENLTKRIEKILQKAAIKMLDCSMNDFFQEYEGKLIVYFEKQLSE